MRQIRLLPALVLLLALLLPTASWASNEIVVALPWEGKATGQVREFSLSAGRVQWELAPGQVVQAYAYNGQVPGPELRVTEGDLVRVTFTNTLDEPTTVHWHGIDLPVGMDGMPGHSQDPVMPGASFTYEFIATPAGTHWYHSHVNEITQLGGGLSGAFIVEPREAAVTPADREYTLMTGDWSVTQMTTFAQRPIEPSGDHSGHGSGHVVERPAIDLFAINGKAYPQAASLTVREGERVRLRIVNAGITETKTFALAGHQLTLTHSDGHPLAQPVQAEAVMLGAGERVDVEFVANNPGRWQLRGLGPSQVDLGLAVDVVYEGHEGDAVRTLAAGARPKAVSYLAMSGPARAEGATDQVYTLTLSESTTAANMWTINGTTAPDIAPIEARPGERIRLAMENVGYEDHPMHLHGHSFQVVSIDGQEVDGPIKDTLTIRRGERYEVEFVANNPGTWMLHCHNLVHVMNGMTLDVIYR